jgi:hypothetical protein
MRPVKRGDAPTRADGTAKFYKSYRDLRIDLISRLGEYCSYCEVPLGVSLAVEHMLSQKWSLNDIDWNNSLLACTNCNSRKKDATVSEKSLGDYYWPPLTYDTAPTNTFDMLLYSRANVTLQSLIDAGLLRLPAARANRPYVQARYDMVWVSVNPSYAGTNAEEKIKRSINLTGLNDYAPADENPKVSDRRVVNRTKAWESAHLAASHLNKYFEPYNVRYGAATTDPARNQIVLEAGGDLKIDLLMGQIKALAAATGFWSVWITAFRNTSLTFVNDAVRNQLVCELFVKPFAGTRLPFAGINSCP